MRRVEGVGLGMWLWEVVECVAFGVASGEGWVMFEMSESLS